MSILNEFTNKTRREDIFKLQRVLEDKDLLSIVVGQSFLVDISLYMVAMNDPELMNNLLSVLNVKELLDDVRHYNNSRLLKAERCKLMDKLNITEG